MVFLVALHFIDESEHMGPQFYVGKSVHFAAEDGLTNLSRDKLPIIFIS